MNAADYIRGMRVRYIPGVASGDKTHPFCEDGTVSSNNGKYVFVRFDEQVQKLGFDGATSKSCDPSDLIHTNP